MKYDGAAFILTELEDGIHSLTFDLQEQPVNTLGEVSLKDLEELIPQLEKNADVKGLILNSAKESFIVGADIGEFLPAFSKGDEAVRTLLTRVCDLFLRIEDLPFPTVAAINGYALGGGLEYTLCCDYRIASNDAKLGLPETKLGILPGWGGTIRLPRLVGVDTAVEWIAGGAENKSLEAFKVGVVDAVVERDNLLAAALKTIKRLISEELSYKGRREQKRAPLKHNDIESLMAFETSKAFVAAKAGKHYPAPVKAIKVMQETAKMSMAEARDAEMEAFVKLAKTSVARAWVGLFLGDQAVMRKAKNLAKSIDSPVERAAVLGAGIMGGGIAYQSASKRIPVKMKDIAQQGIDAGLAEAKALLLKQLERGKIAVSDVGDTLNRIEPCLAYDGFSEIDIVVEAVVENEQVKKSVLAQIEENVSDNAILCSNTSTISINALSEGLQRPENFCGMHFFNPVHRMPLVEIIRSQKSSDTAIAKAVSYALSMGKKPIVVNDCPGFLVNRVLFAYLAGFAMLVHDGADFREVDRIMERWGWPMGPAYLLDVVGMDTVVHAQNVMALGFPSRMKSEFKSCTDLLFERGRLGQKNNKGFYDYALNKKGKIEKHETQETVDLFPSTKEFSEEQVVARLMVPMATELARCLDESVIDSVEEADLALIYGLGFPPFRGGLFSWIDEIGVSQFIAMAGSHKAQGSLYEPTESMCKMAESNQTYYTKA